MIPLRLRVRNFLCYRDAAPVLDLEGVHLACLCGANGHGKSALLDAITWALWGEARGKQQEELVHTGQDEMLVELEFLAREARYRVERRYVARGRRRQGQSSLLLQVWHGQGWSPVPGNTVRETEERLQSLLGMDYRTFINSAFLLQGRADAFTSAPPAERKEVLARVLELNLYDRLEERAKQAMRRCEGQAAALDAEVRRLRAEAALEPQHQEALARAEASLRELSLRLEAALRLRDAAAQQVEVLRTASNDLEELEQRLPALQEEQEHLRRQVAAAEGRVREHEALVARMDAIRQGYQRLQQARGAYEALNQKLARLNELSGQRAPLAQAVAAEEARLQQHAQELRRRIADDLAPRAGALASLEAQLQEARDRSEALAQEEAALAVRRVEQEGRVAQAAGRVAELRAQERDMAAALARQGELLRLREPLARAVGDALAHLQAQRDALLRQAQAAEPVAAELDARETALAAAQAELERLEARQAQVLEERRAQVQALRDRAGQLQAEAGQLQAQEQDVAGRLAFLRQHQHGGARCPLCDAELGAEGQERLARRYREELAALQARRGQHAAALAEALGRADEAAAELPRFEAVLARPRRELEQRVAFLTQRLAEAQKAVADLAAARQALAQVEERIAQGGADPQQRARLEALERELATLRYDPQEHARLRQGLQDAEAEHAREQRTLAEEVARREAAVAREALTTRAQVEALARQAEEARRAAAELTTVRGALASLKDRLARQDFASEQRGRLAELDAAIAALGYSDAAHRQARAQVEQLAPAEEQHRRLEEALRSLPQERQDLARLVAIHQRRTAELAQQAERRDQLRGQVVALPQAQRALDEAAAHVRSLELARDEMVRQHASLEDAVRRAREAAREAEERHAALLRTQEEQGLYQELAFAFSKNGVQAMLIDQVLPLIEEEANLLLGRMTDGRMHVRLQLESRARGREELQVLIGDELSTRSYELFSGGEAFRINLALRIALSKVLARRSGAPLPTLFIDEGFGTQDAAGRERIVDVIRAIQHDFQKIVVITHLDELKDQFPVRIEVEKLLDGSTFRVIWED